MGLINFLKIDIFIKNDTLPSNMDCKISIDDVIETPEKAFDYVVSKVFADVDDPTQRFLANKRKELIVGNLEEGYQKVLDFAAILYSHITGNLKPSFEFADVPNEYRGNPKTELKIFLEKYCM